MPASQCSTRTGGALTPHPGPAEAAAPPPALPGVIEPPPRQASILVTEASGQHFQDPAPAKPPKLYPPLPVSTDKKGREMFAIKQKLHSARELEGTKENRQEICNANCCSGKIHLGPSGKISSAPRDRTVLQPVPLAPGPITAKPVCPLLRFWSLEE